MVIQRSKETVSKENIYFMAAAPNIRKMSDLEGSTVEIADWLIYDDDKDPEDIKTICAILTTDGEAYASNSAVFKKDFENILDIFGDDIAKIGVIGGETKNNRHYITCVYAK